jgi:DNA polymerase-3 subunit delta'
MSVNLELIEKTLDSAKLHHAYLIIGHESEVFAKEFVQSIFCSERCGECANCYKLAKDVHPDLIWVTKSGKRISIDQIRQLQQQALYAPTEADRKVYVLEQIEDLSLEAANSLLKILEQPPKFLVFILTARSANILPTILSRCQVIRLQASSSTDVENEVKARNFSGEALDYLMSVTKGLPHWLALVSFEEGFDPIAERDRIRAEIQTLPNENKLIQALGESENFIAQREIVLTILQRLRECNSAQILKIAKAMTDELETERIERFIQEGSFWYRDLLAAREKGPIFNRDFSDFFQEHVAKIAESTLIEAIKALETVPWALQRNANVQLLLESLLLKLKSIA